MNSTADRTSKEAEAGRVKECRMIEKGSMARGMAMMSIVNGA